MRRIGERILFRLDTKRFIGIVFVLGGVMISLGLEGCVGKPPKTQFALASVALDYARASRAEELTPNLWLEAEHLYRDAQEKYKKREYSDARVEFFRARRLAERAEDTARLKRFQSGGDSL